MVIVKVEVELTSRRFPVNQSTEMSAITCNRLELINFKVCHILRHKIRLQCCEYLRAEFVIVEVGGNDDG